MPKFAANLSMLFPELPFLDRFEAAARAGFKAVEFLFPYEHEAQEIRRRLDRFGLRQVLFNLSPGDWGKGERGLAALPGREQEFAASVDQAIAYAQALECPQVHIMAGLAFDIPLEQASATYGANLRWAANRLQSCDIRALIEPLNSRDMPGYFLTTAEQAHLIIETVGHPNLFLQMDLYHAQIMGGDLAERTRSHWPLIRHIQIAGVPGRHEPDVGEINYPYLFDLLDGLGYDGWIGCEYRPRADTRAGLGWARRYGIGAE
jgi:hydroxypyruvate isomerase